jgi:protein tyrosine phosphatase (PTP) superfamily phosphohydrolase (DUF442 family)
VKEIYNYLYYNEHLSGSGMPTAEQMNVVAESGVQVVINLAPHDVAQALENESELVTSLGMQYVNIPIPWGAPATEHLTRFMDTMDANPDKKIHVHCEANYRASAFVMLYRVKRLGWEAEQAIGIMERMWNPEDFPVWSKFLDEHLSDRISKYTIKP